VGQVGPGGSIDLDEALLVAEFRTALRRFLRSSELTARAHGLTPQRYLLLLMIKGAPDRSERATVTQLSQRLHLAQNSVTELVARSVEAGLVEREPSPDDARVSYLRVSAEGERRLRDTLNALAGERRALRQAIEALEP
jgi:DNA-binding MarR family transcriptional regulator